MRFVGLLSVLLAACAGDPAPGAGDGGGGGGGAPAGPCEGKDALAGDATITVTAGGRERTFQLHVPPSYDPARRTPVVLNFHGYNMTAAQQQAFSLMGEKADAAGFLVVHPEGVGAPQSWNAGPCCGDASTQGADDVAFTRAILDWLDGAACVDRARVYATGMSNGGLMTHRLACELADRIAAVAPVAGPNVFADCAPSRPMPVMHFHGTADTVVPYGGSAMFGFPDVEEMIRAWADRDQCTGDPEETFRQGDSVCKAWTRCAAGAEVILCTVDGGGHTWPGGVPVAALGKTTTDLSATDAMWTFFERHPLP